MASLATVRDALLISRYQNILDDVEFALLYDESSSRLTFPYYKFERFDIDAWDESECRTELRFGKQDLDLLRRNLQIPDEIVCSQRSVCDGMEAMCILLKRLAYPCRYTECESVRSKVVSIKGCFDRNKSNLFKQYLAWQWIKERRIICICIESQFLSFTLLSKPLLRPN